MRTSVNPSTRSNDFKGTEELVTPKAPPTPSANTIFTEDAAAKAREILRRKLRNLRKKTPGLEFNGQRWVSTKAATLPDKNGTPKTGDVSEYFVNHPTWCWVSRVSSTKL